MKTTSRNGPASRNKLSLQEAIETNLPSPMGQHHVDAASSSHLPSAIFCRKYSADHWYIRSFAAELSGSDDVGFFRITSLVYSFKILGSSGGTLICSAQKILVLVTSIWALHLRSVEVHESLWARYCLEPNHFSQSGLS